MALVALSRGLLTQVPAGRSSQNENDAAHELITLGGEIRDESLLRGRCFLRTFRADGGFPRHSPPTGCGGLSRTGPNFRFAAPLLPPHHLSSTTTTTTTTHTHTQTRTLTHIHTHTPSPSLSPPPHTHTTTTTPPPSPSSPPSPPHPPATTTTTTPTPTHPPTHPHTHTPHTTHHPPPHPNPLSPPSHWCWQTV